MLLMRKSFINLKAKDCSNLILITLAERSSRFVSKRW